MLDRLRGYVDELSSSSFIRSSFVYLSGGVVNAALPFLLMPILTRYLTPTDYGIVATSTVLIQILTVALGINAFGLIGRYYFDNDVDAHRKLVSTSILLAGFLSVLFTLVVLPAGGLLEQLTKFPASWAVVVVLIALCTIFQNTYLSLVQAKKQPRRYIGIQILSTSLNLGLSLLFVVAMGMDWEGRMLAIVFSAGVIAIVSLHGLVFRLKLLRPVFDRPSLRALLSFGIPLIPHFIGGWVMTMAARLYLNHMATVADTGLFAVGFNVASPIALVIGAMNQAYWPTLFGKLSTPGFDRLRLARILLIGAFVLPLCAVAYGMAARWFLPVIVGPRFYDAANYVLWLALAFAMQGVYFIFANFVVYSKKTSLIAWRADFLGGLAVLGLCPLLIHLSGPIGAAEAMFLAFAVSTLGAFTASRKAYPMPWGEAFLSFVNSRHRLKASQTVPVPKDVSK
jgi:O-antigen/teichoic acid export membrane protein